MTPKEKALEILFKINNRILDDEAWNKSSSYAKQELKRKALIVADEVLAEISVFEPCEDYITQTQILLRKQFWKSVKQEINNL